MATKTAKATYKPAANTTLTASILSGALAPSAAVQNALNTAKSAQSTTPKSYTEIAKAYEDKARANLAERERAMANQLAQSKATTAANYDSAAAGNYINYMKQRNSLGEQLASQGIRGGASESAMARIGNNYALNQGNTNAQRYAAYGQLQNTYDTNLANIRQSAEENIANTNMALQQHQLEYEDTLKQRAAEEARYRDELAREQSRYEQERRDKVLEQYAATISRYISVDAIDKAIKKLKAGTNPNKTQMIWLLQQRKAEIKKGKK